MHVYMYHGLTSKTETGFLHLLQAMLGPVMPTLEEQAILQRLQGKICQLEKALSLRCCLFSTLLLLLGRLL